MSTPTSDAIHSHHYRNAQKSWLQYLMSNWPIYSLGILFVIFTDLFQVLVTRSMGWILDFFAKKPIPEFFNQGERDDTFFLLFLTIIGLRILLFFCRMGWRLTMARQTHKASSELKSEVWENVRYFKSDDLVKRFTKGVLMNASTSDVNSGRFIYGFTLVGMFDVVFLGIFTLLTMLTIHMPLTLYAFAILLVLPIFIRKLSSLEMVKYRDAQENLGEFNDLSTQVVSTIRLQRVNQTGRFWYDRLKKMANNYRLKRLDAVYTSLRYIPVMGSSSIISYIVLFFIGIPFVLKGSMSIGDFVAMQGLIFLLQDPLFELGFIISEWKKSFTSLSRLDEIYKLEKDPYLSNVEKKQARPRVSKVYDQESSRPLIFEVKNLSFRFNDAQQDVISDLSFELKQTKRLGITGPIGSGKSTLIKILSGLERDFRGELHFRGHSFEEYTHDDLRKMIGHVSQKPFLFADTIRSNITLDQDMSDDEVWHFLKLACLDEDVRNFEFGLETPLGEWGINLSGGQKQRLTLARALARKCEIYLFDDCLSAVDTITEEKILTQLNENLSEETLVWVAHRKSTLKYCDVLLEF